ncbi:unnamed protein product [Triticum turgidum subsp. durum]|uniref:Uncharacterized protein n=1 Tax=Triticum turgidum subsp. durum TaxID=4567 RepID=A0A9R0VH39_TRITD|nr:unnamed protein product [Triticum turgidum subsp. durum]
MSTDTKIPFSLKKREILQLSHVVCRKSFKRFIHFSSFIHPQFTDALSFQQRVQGSPTIRSPATPGSNPFAATPGRNPFTSTPGSHPFATTPGGNPFAATTPGGHPIAATPGSHPIAATPGNISFAVKPPHMR